MEGLTVDGKVEGMWRILETCAMVARVLKEDLASGCVTSTERIDGEAGAEKRV